MNWINPRNSIMKILLFVLASIIGFILQAQSQSTKEDCDCPPPTKEQITDLCLHVKRGTFAAEDSPFVYSYEQTIRNIACVDATDTEKEAKWKVNRMWMKYRTCLSCKVTGFSIPAGNVLKLSVDSAFPDFIKGMIIEYGIDVNFIDPADGKTLLQYIDDQIEMYQIAEGAELKIKELMDIKRVILSYQNQKT